jgi:hypothetical protein
VLNTALKNALTEIDKDFFVRLSGVYYPAFDTDTDVAPEKVFDVPTTNPSMVGLEVAVVGPLGSRKGVRTPKTNVKLSVGIPFRTKAVEPPASSPCRHRFQYRQRPATRSRRSFG